MSHCEKYFYVKLISQYKWSTRKWSFQCREDRCSTITVLKKYLEKSIFCIHHPKYDPTLVVLINDPTLNEFIAILLISGEEPAQPLFGWYFWPNLGSTCCEIAAGAPQKIWHVLRTVRSVWNLFDIFFLNIRGVHVHGIFAYFFYVIQTHLVHYFQKKIYFLR